MNGGGDAVAAALVSTPARRRRSGQLERMRAREGCSGSSCARQEEEGGEKRKMAVMG
jgi:hypothetical protein